MTLLDRVSFQLEPLSQNIVITIGHAFWPMMNKGLNAVSVRKNRSESNASYLFPLKLQQIREHNNAVG